MNYFGVRFFGDVVKIFQSVLGQKIVAVKEGNIFSGRGLHRLVSRNAGKAGIFFHANQFQSAFKFGSESRNNRDGIIRAAVICDENFKILKSLRQKTFQTVRDVFFHIVHGRYDRNCRRIFFAAGFFLLRHKIFFPFCRKFLFRRFDVSESVFDFADVNAFDVIVHFLSELPDFTVVDDVFLAFVSEDCNRRNYRSRA